MQKIKLLQLISNKLFLYGSKAMYVGLVLLSFNANCQNAWTQKSSPPTPFTARNACAGFSVGNKGYFGTGGDLAGVTSDWFEYDPSTDSWTQKTSFP